MTAIETLRGIRDELNQTFVERAEVIEGALAALLSRSHVLLIGPPGTAKSMLADELCRRIEGAVYFQWLLTKFTTPEEIFGAVSLAALERDEYRRVTDAKLPRAHLAFLDEVFKANSSILNAILTVVNERLFHNGRAIDRVPLLTLFGATNELPEEDELAALYDRFLLRFVVQYVREDFRFLRMLEPRPTSARATITLSVLGEAQAEADAVVVSAGVLRLLTECRRELGRKGIIASDRRYRQALGVLRAHAILDGRREVEEEDLFFLEHVLWRDPAEQAEVRATLRTLLQGHEDEVQELLFQSRELRDYALREWDTREMRSRAVIEVHTKLRNILTRVESLVETAREGGRPVERMQAIREEIRTIQDQMLQSF
ncbi:MAG: MoxR-like ATPase [Candidatus Binatota bacterium]|jgi:MoxR-like ATPase|nr:MoxR-like ATPase [Candidatus Binatota bacterium]